MDIRLDGRVALITGGSKGLGLATARRMVESGADVALLARGQEALDAARAEVERARAGARVLALACDVATAEGCARGFAAVEAALGRVDILVNNAGIGRTGPFMNIADAEWQADLDLKLFAAIRLARLAWPGMTERRWGRIINVLNIGAKAPAAGAAPTSVTRAAGMALTKVLAGEGAPHNVLVNALCIGKIDSDQWVQRHRNLGSGESYEHYLARLGAEVPLGRYGRPEEFADLACFLASESGGYITGTAINVDGNLSPVP